MMRKLYLYLETILVKLGGNPNISIDAFSSPKFIYLLSFFLIILVILLLVLWIILILIPLSYLELQGNNIFKTSVSFNYFDNNSNNIYYCKGLSSDSKSLIPYSNPNKRPLPFSTSEVHNPPKKLKTLAEILNSWPGPTTFKGRAVTADAVIRADWNKTLSLISKVRTLFDQIASGAEYDINTKQFKIIRKEGVRVQEFELLIQKLEELMAGVSRWAIHMAHKVNHQQEVDKDYYIRTGRMINSPEKYYELYVVLDQFKDPYWFFRLDPRIEQLRW